MSSERARVFVPAQDAGREVGRPTRTDPTAIA